MYLILSIINLQIKMKKVKQFGIKKNQIIETKLVIH